MTLRFSRTCFLHALNRPLLFLLACSTLLAASSLPQAQMEKRPDGVEHWYIPELPNSDSYLTRMFKQIYDVVSFTKKEPPFGKSIAFLAGVSKYRYLSPQLLSVKNDVADMREFLLKKAGFDEVYVAMDEVVSRTLVESYVKKIIPQTMQKNDRLLFYYSGHGGDAGGTTGYMQFANAQKDDFTGESVLAVSSLKDWGPELKNIGHLLVILDSCSSGLGIAPKADYADPPDAVVKSLSGNGSRRVLTAGTANERTYAEDREKNGHSFFTKALLTTFDSLSSNPQTGFITITELFAGIEKQMSSFADEYGKSTHPRIWQLQESDYLGTFVFLNLKAKGAKLNEDQLKATGAKLLAKGEEVAPTNLGAGIVLVKSATAGLLLLDGENKGSVVPGQTRTLPQISAGRHQIQVQGPGGETKNVTVEGGKPTYVSFGFPFPLDPSAKVPVGSLQFTWDFDKPGEVFIDDYSIHVIQAKAVDSIGGVLVGQHEIRITGADGSETSFPFRIQQNQITSFGVIRPAPPTGLTAIVK